MSDPILDPLRAQMRRQVVRFLVARQITCPRTSEVLDYRTCVVLNDSDGDPAYVLSQAGWAQVVAEGNDALLAKTAGLTVDPASVQGAAPEVAATPDLVVEGRKTVPAIGDYYIRSWGYDQTNVNFYRVVGFTASGKSVRIVEVHSQVVDGDGGPSEHVIASEHTVPDAEVMTKRLRPGSPWISINHYDIAQIWDGKPAYRTGSGWGH